MKKTIQDFKKERNKKVPFPITDLETCCIFSVMAQWVSVLILSMACV